MNGPPLKVILKSPYSLYTGYGQDGFGLLRALHEWGCDVYPQPVWLDVPIPKDLMPLFGKTLLGPFDLTINHWDPAHLYITREARKLTRVAVAWSMWEFSGGPGPRPDGKADLLRHQHPDWTDEQVVAAGGRLIPGPVSGFYPHCENLEEQYDSEGLVREGPNGGMRTRLQWFDMLLGYDQVSLDAFMPFLSKPTHPSILQGGYEPRMWRHIDRDWFGERFQFLMHGALNDRKCPWTTIEAFQKLKFEKGAEFAGARLLLHSSQPGVLFPELNEPFAEHGIRVSLDSIPQPRVRDMYAASHCLLAPSRGEGKNLPALEFMTTGGAVAATNYSGHTQWISADWAYPLDYKLQATFGDAAWGAHDARVSVDHLADVMWHIFTHRGEVREKARKAEEIIPKMCSWDVVVEHLFQRIRDTVPGPGPQVYDAAMACRKQRDEEPGPVLLQ